ncbi:hypothetical protein V7T12_11845, partial [Segatella copri]
MRHFITIVLLILLPLCAKADNSQLYKQLDAAIEKRAHYVEVKEKSLNDIKQGAKYVTSNEDKLKLYEQLANGYKAYEYDSAMTYNRVGGKRSSFLPTFVFRPLTPPYVRFRIRRFLFWIP